MAMTLSIKRPAVRPAPETLFSGTVLLKSFLITDLAELLTALPEITAASPFRHMKALDGTSLPFALTNCGTSGWITDRHGAKFVANDPQTGRLWPRIPTILGRLAKAAALEAGFTGFIPNACLLARHAPGAFSSLFQDQKVDSSSHPVVCFAIGLPATYELCALLPEDPASLVRMGQGDAVVFSDPSRVRLRGIAMTNEPAPPEVGLDCLSITFRKVA